MSIINKIKEIFQSEKKEKKIISYLIILSLLGILLMSFNFKENNINIENKEERVGENMNFNSENSYIDKLENDLEDLLRVMKGVGKVKVKIILAKDSAYEYKYNTNNYDKKTVEKDNDGKEREIIENEIEKEAVIIRNLDGSEEIVKERTTMPTIKGVIIVAEGAEDYQINYKINKAVSNFFNIPLYKVNVLTLEGR
ncbi:MAG: hypothetical protein ACQEQF_00930 [Bacillota bacterium]